MSSIVAGVVFLSVMAVGGFIGGAVGFMVILLDFAVFGMGIYYECRIEHIQKASRRRAENLIEMHKAIENADYEDFFEYEED